MNQWSYYPWIAKAYNVDKLTDALNLLGADGWELVTSQTTVKTWWNTTGNDLVFVFKKAGTGHRPDAQQLAALAGYDPNVAY